MRIQYEEMSRSVEEALMSKLVDKKHRTAKTVSMQASVGMPCDRGILKALGPVVDGLAQYFGKHFEVVLHTTEDLLHSVIKIENGSVTGRTVGAPMTDYGIEILKRAETSNDSVFDSYLTTTSDGRTLRSFSAVIRNDLGKPIGLLCFNMDMSAPLIDYLETASSKDTQSRPLPGETFPSSASDLVRASLNRALSRVEGQHSMSSTKRNRLIVAELYGMGVFDIKDATHLVAREMGVSVYTVYNYVREARFLRNQDDMSHVGSGGAGLRAAIEATAANKQNS
jgi:predicted transcriptional regulator YheO